MRAHKRSIALYDTLRYTDNLTIAVPIIGFRLSLPLKVFIYITFAETPIASNAVSS